MTLLVVVMCISFFDRGNLAVAAPILAPELGLSPWALGILLSAFFWTYALFQIVSGWAVDRIQVRLAYAAGFLIWSVATLGTGLVSTFAGLLVMRFLLGIGESVTYPASSRILAAVFPENRRGLANALIDLGARIGPAAGTFGGALLVAGGSQQAVNAWEASAPRPTFDPANPWAGDLDAARCIDHLFALSPEGEPAATFSRCERVLDRPGSGVLPSDHYGVLAELPMP